MEPWWVYPARKADEAVRRNRMLSKSRHRKAAAMDFAAWLDKAEIGELEQLRDERLAHHRRNLNRAFSQSRHRKAAAMDFAAVMLLMVVMGALGAFTYLAAVPR